MLAAVKLLINECALSSKFIFYFDNCSMMKYYFLSNDALYVLQLCMNRIMASSDDQKYSCSFCHAKIILCRH